MDATNASTAMVVPLTGYVLAWVYPLYINVWNKELMDSHRSTMVGIEPKPQRKEDIESNSMEKHGIALTQELTT
jgi:FHS family L-fucose permease-like MFS transporter